MKIGETINRYIQDAGDIDIGTVIEILILNRLCGFHTPLYAMSQWASDHGIDEIYGIDAKKLTDDRCGASLDRIFEHRDALDGQLTVNLVETFDVDVRQIHFDASSFVVVGEPAARSGDPASIHVTLGRDGKGNTNRRLVRFGLAVTGLGSIPLFGKAYGGNAMDYEMHPEFLANLLKIMPAGDFLFVSDSKFDSADNFACVFAHDGTFLCPGVFRQDLQERVAAILDGGAQWEDIEYVAKADRKKARNKRARYRAFETAEEISFEIDGEVRVFVYRLIFVHSSRKAALQKKTREKRMRRIAGELDGIAFRLNTRLYTTREYIEKKIAEALGRNETGKLFEYRLVERDGFFFLEHSIKGEELAKLEKLDGIYTLKTNLDGRTHGVDRVFSIYKQQGRIEHRIKAVKGPLHVAPIHLKDPKRIAAMFFVVVQALKVYSIVEWETRKAIAERGEPIPVLPEGRKTMNPSGETILRVFDRSVSILVYETDGKTIRKLTAPDETQRMIFRLLCLPVPDLRSLSRKFGKFRNRGEP